MKIFLRAMLIALVSGLFPPLSRAGENVPSASGSVEDKERQFIAEAAQDCLLDAAFGRVAQEKGSAPAVRKIGELLVSEHRRATNELQMIAASRGLTIPQEMDRKRLEAYHKLANEDGEKFDSAFLEALKLKRQETAERLQAALSNLDEPELKAYAASLVPVPPMLEASVRLVAETK